MDFLQTSFKTNQKFTKIKPVYQLEYLAVKSEAKNQIDAN